MSDVGCSMLGPGAWGWPREMLWGGRWEGGSCLGTHVRIKDFKIKKKKKRNEMEMAWWWWSAGRFRRIHSPVRLQKKEGKVWGFEKLTEALVKVIKLGSPDVRNAQSSKWRSLCVSGLNRKHFLGCASLWKFPKLGLSHLLWRCQNFAAAAV